MGAAPGPEEVKPPVDFALRLLIALVPVGYFAVARRAGADFRGERKTEPAARSLRLLEIAVLGAHLLLGLLLGLREGRVPISNGPQMLSALALALFGTFFLATRGGEARGLTVFVAPAAFVLQVLASGFGLERAAPAAPGRGGLFAVHVATAVLAASVMVLSGLAGWLYLLLERQMRRKTFGLLFARLPNLSELATLNRRAALLGFLCMAVGVNWGIWLAHDAGTPGFSYRDPKVVATLALWVHFGLIALPRRFAYVTGRRAASAAAFGLVLLCVTFLMSAVPGLSFHR
jgi:ABC-type uncharacterized transport system permease subunit